MSATKVLVVTGASRGIGRAVALLAAAEGYDVCINYASAEAAAREVVRAVEARGRRAVAVRADVSREEEVVALFEAADALGPVRGLVNNAGILPPHGRVDAITAERLQRVFAVNVIGSFLCAREAVRRMSTRHGGSGGAIVNVSSIASVLGSPGRTVDYAATKGAVDTFIVGLAKEVAEEGIRVNAVRPGPIETEVFETIGAADYLQTIAAALPMRRVGTPDEVAQAVLWLLSERASYVTGAHVNMAGAR